MTRLVGSALTLDLGGRRIVDGVDLQLGPGELLGLIGPNGAGKSSLLRLLAGLLEADSGEVRLDQCLLADYGAGERARRIAWLPQQAEVHWPVSVEMLVGLGRSPHLGDRQGPGQGDRAIIEQVLRQTGLLGLRQRPFPTLSGGERARVLLARALVTQPQCLLADEPVAALDPAHQLDVMELLGDYCSRGMGSLVVLHDLALAARFCSRLVLLHQGRVLAAGPAAEVLTSANLARAYGIAVDPACLFAHPWRRIPPAAGPGG